MTIAALISAIHQGSRSRRRLHHLDVAVEVGRVLLGDADDARGERAVDARAELDRRAVRADADRRRRSRSPRRSASAAASSISASGRWNCSSGTRSTGGAGEERPVAEEPQRAEEVLAGRRLGGRDRRDRRRRGRVYGGAGRQRRPLADLAEGQAAVELLGELLEDDGRVRRELDAEALGELARSRRARPGTGGITARRSRCTRPSRLTTCRRARGSACPGRTRSAQPTASPWNIVIAITCSACSASARTAGSDAASSPETISSPIGSGFASSPSAAAAQASATPRPFGVAGRWKARAAGLAVEAERVRELREPGAAAAAAARPDQDRALGGAQHAELAAGAP